MSHSEAGLEDATRQLVRAMVGHDDEAARSLARRVLGSQIGVHDTDRKQADLSNCWRRVSRKAAYQRHRPELEQAYKSLERQCSSDDRDLPPKVLTVLTKLMGKQMKSPPPFRQSSTHHEAAVKPKARNPVNKALREQQTRDEKIKLVAEEARLLRECLYSLQGIDGERIRYHHKSPDTFSSDVEDYEGVRVKSSALENHLLYSGRDMETRLGSGSSDALRICAEAGWLYNRTQSYIQLVQHDDSKGVIARAFAGTLAEELREYHSLLASYEAKLETLSLRQLMVDLRMPTNRLKILAMLTDGLRTLSGGHLLSALHKHTIHGDTRHSNLVQSILCQVSKPWFDILYRWTTHGVLSDPHKEFFVTEFSNVEDKYLWTAKYQINQDQIPSGILDPELVAPAYNVGKGINFIRKCLLDGKWTMHLQFDNTGERGYNDLGYKYQPHEDSNSALQATLKKAAGLVHSHILKTLKEENHLMDHLFALKQFLFLGQGDFFSALIEGLFTEWHGQVGIVGIYKHSLLSIVEGALRSTNAKSLPQFCLDRLQVELLLDKDDDAHHMFGPGRSPNKQDDHRTVWDIFMLDYKIPDPLIAIVHPAALNKYKTVFRLLFNLKKVEFMLNYTWRQSASLQHALHTTARYNGINVSTDSGYMQATFLLRKISILRQSMMHLIVNLKSYLMFEVLEGGWQRLVAEIQEAKTLDEAIEAHDAYLNGIVKKSLLKGDSKEYNKQHHLAEQIETLLSISNEFCNLQEGLFREALILADVASEQRLEAQTRLKQGQWGFDSELDVADDETFFGLADVSTLREVVRISKVYDENALELLNVLTAIVDGNPDDYMDENFNRQNESRFETSQMRRDADVANNDLDPQRFLIAQLDHNHYYGSQAV
eukprot:scaffold880_cov132-Cylindrotheca_fusiformis.AAC.26